MNRSAEDGTAAVTGYESFKRSYLATENTCQEEGFNFIPIICEANEDGAQLHIQCGMNLPNTSLF